MLLFFSNQFKVLCCQEKLYFGILTLLPTLNLGSFSLFLTSKSIYDLVLTSVGFILIVLWHLLLYSLTLLSNLSTVFWYWSQIFVDFIFKSFNKSFKNNRFSFVMLWLHFYIIILQPWFSWSDIKFASFTSPYFFLICYWICIKVFEKHG